MRNSQLGIMGFAPLEDGSVLEPPISLSLPSTSSKCICRYVRILVCMINLYTCRYLKALACVFMGFVRLYLKRVWLLFNSIGCDLGELILRFLCFGRIFLVLKHSSIFLYFGV